MFILLLMVCIWLGALLAVFSGVVMLLNVGMLVSSQPAIVVVPQLILGVLTTGVGGVCIAILVTGYAVVMAIDRQTKALKPIAPEEVKAISAPLRPRPPLPDVQVPEAGPAYDGEPAPGWESVVRKDR